MGCTKKYGKRKPLSICQSFFGGATPCGMQNLCSPTRDQIHAPCTGSTGVLTTGSPGKSLSEFSRAISGPVFRVSRGPAVLWAGREEHLIGPSSSCLVRCSSGSGAKQLPCINQPCSVDLGSASSHPCLPKAECAVEENSFLVKEGPAFIYKYVV